MATEKLWKRVVSRSQSPQSFGSLLEPPNAPKVVNKSGRRLSFDEIQSVEYHISYHGHCDEGFPLHCILDAVKGCAMGFGVWVVPVSLFYRKISGLRRGVALGAFLGSFRAISCTLFRILNAKRGRNKTDFVRRFVNAISGWASGMIFSSIDHEVTNAIFVLWVAVRAIRLVLPSLPYSDVLIMMFSASNILSTYVHRPGDNTASYAAFLNKFGGKSQKQLHPYRETTEGKQPPLCQTIHPGQSCVPHFITFTLEGMQRAIPLYIPVHLVGLVLSSHKSIPQFLSNVIRSSAFLSVYCSSAWLAACYYYKYLPFKETSRVRTLLPELLPGLSVLIERPSRRKELANYCLSHALNSYWNWAKRKWDIKPNRFLSILILGFSFGTLAQHFELQPNAITSIFFGIHEYPVVLKKNINIRTLSAPQSNE